MASPTVNIIIANWNGRHHLVHCLPSLTATRYTNFHISVVDNGSTDDSLSWLRANYPRVEIVALDKNLGFASANNIGIRKAMAAGSDYALILNNDTRVDPDWLDAFIATAETDPAIAICQARQRTWDGTREIHFRFIPEWAEAEYSEVPVSPPEAASYTPFASGCAMLLRCSTLRDIGLFDERYFMYVEDVDLTLRAWISGYLVMDVPAAIVYHRMVGSNSNSRQRMFWGYRNQLSTLLKLYQPKTLALLAEPISRRWFRTRSRPALQGTVAALSMLPGTMARRRQIQHNRRASDLKFLELCHNENPPRDR